MFKSLLNSVIYVEGGIFSKKNIWINLHLIVSQFLVYAAIAAIVTETQVQLVVALNGDPTLMKVSSLIGLIFSFLANGLTTKERNIKRFRKYYVYLSLVSTILLVVINMIVAIDDFLVLRFVASTIINNSLVTILANVITDTFNNCFKNSERTVFSSKKKCINILGSMIGMVGAFFITADLSSLLIIESVIYIIMLADDVFIFNKLKNQVFTEAEDSVKTTEEKAA